MRDYIIAHIKLIADCSITTKVQLCTPPHSDSGLFPVVLRHDSDSSAARFTATVVISSVYKRKSGSDTRSEIMRFKRMFPSLIFSVLTLNIVTRSLCISKAVKSQCGCLYVCPSVAFKMKSCSQDCLSATSASKGPWQV